jgi:hypothetical protein
MFKHSTLVLALFSFTLYLGLNSCELIKGKQRDTPAPPEDPSLADLRISTDEVSGWTEGDYEEFEADSSLFGIINGGAPAYIDRGLIRGFVQELSGDGNHVVTGMFAMDFGTSANADDMYAYKFLNNVYNKIEIPGFAEEVAVGSRALGVVQVYFHYRKYYFEFAIGGYGADLDPAAADASLFLDLYMSRWE